MSDGFHVDLGALTKLADTMADQQQTVAALGEPMQQRAGQLNTGDPGLDGETRALVARVNDLFSRFGDAFVTIANKLDTAADAYRSFDQNAAESYRSLWDGPSDGESTTAPDSATPVG